MHTLTDLYIYTHSMSKKDRQRLLMVLENASGMGLQMAGSICLENPLLQYQAIKIKQNKWRHLEGPKYKQIYLGKMPLFHPLTKLGLFECYLGLRKDMNLK